MRVDVRRGRHSRRVDGLELPGVVEDAVQLTSEQCLFVSREIEMRERSDAFNLGDREAR